MTTTWVRLDSYNYMIFSCLLTAICTPDCSNGGTCSSLSVCVCTSAWTGGSCAIGDAHTLCMLHTYMQKHTTCYYVIIHNNILFLGKPWGFYMIIHTICKVCKERPLHIMLPVSINWGNTEYSLFPCAPSQSTYCHGFKQDSLNFTNLWFWLCSCYIEWNRSIKATRAVVSAWDR